VIEVAGTRYPLKRGRTVIGRGSDADITIDDSGTSRRHVEILWDGERAQVNDLGSTNGTTLNGERIQKALLPQDSVVQIGRTRIVFRIVPQDQQQRPDNLGNFWGGR
jgi:pSer/pThr/pTyr-binding forkhead associated (FHA) protein